MSEKYLERDPADIFSFDELFTNIELHPAVQNLYDVPSVSQQLEMYDGVTFWADPRLDPSFIAAGVVTGLVKGLEIVDVDPINESNKSTIFLTKTGLYWLQYNKLTHTGSMVGLKAMLESDHPRPRAELFEPFGPLAMITPEILLQKTGERLSEVYRQRIEIVYQNPLPGFQELLV